MPLSDIKAIDRFLGLDFDRTKELQSIVDAASAASEVPFGLITVLDENHQYIAFGIGPELRNTRKEDAFCQYTILSKELLEVPDTLLDGRFVNNPLVTGGPKVRFYAGLPLISNDNHILGSLCIFDRRPRQLSQNQKNILHIFARQIVQILELEHSIQLLRGQMIEIKQSEIKLRSFFESSVASHVLIDRDFKVLTFNKTIRNLLKASIDLEIKEGMDARDYVFKPFLPAFIENYQRALAGETVMSEREINSGRGPVSLQITYEPARGDDGEIIGVSYTSTDITERVRQSRLVLAKEESLRKIAFIQSHHLRGPVASILGIMELIKAKPYYQQDNEELFILEELTEELDQVIRKIVNQASSQAV